MKCLTGRQRGHMRDQAEQFLASHDEDYAMTRQRWQQPSSDALLHAEHGNEYLQNALHGLTIDAELPPLEDDSAAAALFAAEQETAKLFAAAFKKRPRELRVKLEAAYLEGDHMEVERLLGLPY